MGVEDLIGLHALGLHLGAGQKIHATSFGATVEFCCMGLLTSSGWVILAASFDAPVDTCGMNQHVPADGDPAAMASRANAARVHREYTFGVPDRLRRREKYLPDVSSFRRHTARHG